jgi:hypothetical protein
MKKKVDGPAARRERTWAMEIMAYEWRWGIWMWIVKGRSSVFD